MTALRPVSKMKKRKTEEEREQSAEGDLDF